MSRPRALPESTLRRGCAGRNLFDYRNSGRCEWQKAAAIRAGSPLERPADRENSEALHRRIRDANEVAERVCGELLIRMRAVAFRLSSGPFFSAYFWHSKDSPVPVPLAKTDYRNQPLRGPASCRRRVVYELHETTSHP
jgi:hypothetical protein